MYSLYVLNVSECSYIIQQIYLRKSELKKIFSAKVKFAVIGEITLATKTLLQFMSTISNLMHPKQIAVKISYL